MIKKRIYSILAILIFFIGSIIVYNFLKPRPPLSKLFKGEFLTESTLPNGSYTIKTYINNGSLTVDTSVRGELIINNSKIKPQNIYYNYHCKNRAITWINEDTVIINEQIIELPNGYYDWREDANKINGMHIEDVEKLNEYNNFKK
jgi:Family of unknown function (DUF5412)